MPVVDYAQYCEMLDRARRGKVAYPAIIVSSLTTANADGDTQYAFTRAITDHCFTNYDGVLRVDGDAGHKKAYDPRTYLTLAENAMAEQVQATLKTVRSAGTTMPNLVGKR